MEPGGVGGVVGRDVSNYIKIKILIQTPWHLVNVRDAWQEAMDLAFIAMSARIRIFELVISKLLLFHFHFL